MHELSLPGPSLQVEDPRLSLRGAGPQAGGEPSCLIVPLKLVVPFASLCSNSLDLRNLTSASSGGNPNIWESQDPNGILEDSSLGGTCSPGRQSDQILHNEHHNPHVP